MRQYSLVDHLRLDYMKLHYPYKVVDLRRSRLQHLGWCPFQINLLENTVNQSTIDWLAACDIRQDPVGHETCSVEACARNNIDESTYQQAHICHSGHCEKLIPDVQKVVAILKDDDIPIMRLERANEKLRLTVSAASKTKPGNYIAISHVWADGLGGSSERGLNLCQVERLSQLSSSYRKTSNNLWFWVDSLCIPRVQKDVYYKAPVGIRDVYINASTVLVLDKIIERCTLSSSTEYLYAHIYLSAWMQRMWTYEEAVLAQQVVFVLKDGFHVYRVDTPPSMRATVCVIWQCLATQLYRLRVEKSQLNIGHIYHAFRYRLTNAPQEEFLSVSGMLGLDTQSLLELKGEERTQRFWLMLRWIPFNVPFLDCPKLSNPGFRWAPKTMMYPSPTQLDTNVESEQFECTAHGLKGTYLTIFLDQLLKGGAIDERLIRPSKIPRMGDTTNIFYIWVNGSNASITAPGDHRALLRLYCNESWPRPPEFRFFNALILPSREYRRTVIEKGQWVAGAALYHEAGVPGESPSLQSDENPIETCRFEGRLLIERLQNHEFSSGAGTFTFEGSSKIVINAQGIWSIREVCIT